MQQFYRYTQAIADPDNYSNSELPDKAELKRRNDILAKSFDGLMGTKLAVYIVPPSYSLAEICEIFEVLNTTGTKVSTVDLIHSWLYSETANDQQPVLLRDWIDTLGQLNGAMGWSSSTDRPELIAQMATAAYVALESDRNQEPWAATNNSRFRLLSLETFCHADASLEEHNLPPTRIRQLSERIPTYGCGKALLVGRPVLIQ